MKNKLYLSHPHSGLKRLPNLWSGLQSTLSLDQELHQLAPFFLSQTLSPIFPPSLLALLRRFKSFQFWNPGPEFLRQVFFRTWSEWSSFPPSWSLRFVLLRLSYKQSSSASTSRKTLECIPAANELLWQGMSLSQTKTGAKKNQTGLG